MSVIVPVTTSDVTPRARSAPSSGVTSHAKGVEQRPDAGDSLAGLRHLHGLTGIEEAALHVVHEQGRAPGLESQHPFERRATVAHSRGRTSWAISSTCSGR